MPVKGTRKSKKDEDILDIATRMVQTRASRLEAQARNLLRDAAELEAQGNTREAYMRTRAAFAPRPVQWVRRPEILTTIRAHTARSRYPFTIFDVHNSMRRLEMAGKVVLRGPHPPESYEFTIPEHIDEIEKRNRELEEEYIGKILGGREALVGRINRVLHERMQSMSARDLDDLLYTIEMFESWEQ